MNAITPGRFFAMAGVVVLASLASACAQQNGYQVERPAMLQSASTYALAGNYDQAVIAYTDFLGTNTRNEFTGEGYVGRGNAYYKLGSYELAESDFRSGLSAASDRTMKAQATMGMANSVFAMEKFDPAEKLYRQILRTYQGLVPQDEVTYRLGMSLARQGKWDESLQLLGEVAGNYPSGEYAKYARAKMQSVKNRFFTVQVGAYTSKSVADKTLADLKAKGFAGKLDPIDIDGVAGYAVRSGVMASWRDVSDYASKLKDAGFSTYKLP